MMCPGRFPSLTPTRESTPIDSSEPHADIFTSTSQQPRTPDFTAPEALRYRPRFAEVHSEPILSRHGGRRNSKAAFPSPTPGQQISDRRTSDLLRNRSRTVGRTDGHAIQKPRTQHRVVSTPVKQSSITSELPSQNTTSENQDTPCQPLPLSPRKTDAKLRKKLLEPLWATDKDGVVYMIKDAARKELGIKIGFTTCLDYDERMKQHTRDCEFAPTEVYVTQRLGFCKKTETLIHVDLNNFNRHWTCAAKKCDGTIHKEWFTVDEDLAVETVKKWESFMHAQTPYGAGITRDITLFWKYLLRQREIAYPVVDDVCHEKRRKQWALILAAPTHAEYRSFVVDMLQRSLSAIITSCLDIWLYVTVFFWQAVTVVYGFITLIVFRNTFASCAFALVLVCACFSVLPQSRKLKSSGGKSAWI